MEFEKIELNPQSAVIQRRVEEVVNTLVRGYDEVMGRLHLGGRKGDCIPSAELGYKRALS